MSASLLNKNQARHLSSALGLTAELDPAMDGITPAFERVARLAREGVGR